MQEFFQDLVRVFGWSMIAAICMGLGTGLAVKLFDALTPGLEEIDELKKGNVAVAIVLGAVVAATGFVIGMALHGPGGA